MTKPYIASVPVVAKKMTRGEFATTSGILMPFGSDKDEPGYLVTWKPGVAGVELTNVDYDYSAWAPLAEFERNCKEVKTAEVLIKPTIGRKVWFWLNNSAIGSPHSYQPSSLDANQAMDATVVFVHSDRCVNLLVIDHAGYSHVVQNCRLHHTGDDMTDGKYCEWMPFQTNQAKNAAPAAISDDAEDAVRTAAGQPEIFQTELASRLLSVANALGRNK